jgi:tripartite-type tricarboxylate transporter receptor subunit TctC
MRRLVAFIAGITCAVAIRAPVAAQEFPSRPLTLVVPFAAGGSTGLIARMMLPRMSEVLGQQIVIENMGGAGQRTGRCGLVSRAIALRRRGTRDRPS